jgi:hypothetical protein
MPAGMTVRVVDSFRQPNAALLTAIGPEVCVSPVLRRGPGKPQRSAAARARRLQLTTDLSHQVSYGQHVTPQTTWSRIALTRRDRLASRRGRHRVGIKKAAVCHRELRFDHLPD